jgi:hypothetical protein
MGYPHNPQDPYGQQYGQSGPHFPQPYGQSGPQYPQPYSQPYIPVPQAPQYGPVQMVTVRERGFNPITMVVHLCLWVFLHWWLAGCTLGLWLLAAIPLTFIGWNVTRTVPVQQYQQPYPPMYPH